MKVITRKIKIPEGVIVSPIENGVELDYSGVFKLPLKWANCDIRVQENHLIIEVLKMWDSKMRAIYTTWVNLVKKYEKNPIFKYKVTCIYKHFPIKMSLNGKEISIYNYYGLKSQFKVNLSDFISAQIKEDVLYVQTYNDIITGADLNKLKALRYRTHHKNLDRRIFTDGFLVERIE